MADTFQSVQQLVTELIAYKQANPTKKIAFVLQGGGARAAWYGGVLEAIESEVRKQQPTVAPELRFAPDILVGNSGGALAAVAYFSDLMNPGTYGRYTSKQSWLWRSLSENNDAANKLLDNAGILELISGSKTGGTGSILPSLNNPHMLYNMLPKIGSIGNMAENLSPHYNFQTLFKSRADLWAAWNDLKVKFDDFKTAMDNLTVPNLIAGINLQQASSVLRDDVNAIKDRVDAVRNDVATIKGHLSHTAEFMKLKYPDQVPDAFQVPLLRDSAAVANEIGDTINHLKNELDRLALTAGEGLLTKIRIAFETLHDLIGAIRNEISALLNRVLQIVTHLDDCISLIVTTVMMAKNHSSLMNTSGLEKAIHEALRQATPTITAKTAKASSLDSAIFAHWNARRAAKALDPNVRAPELILLASNISAGRPTLLCMCDQTTKQSLASSHTWVVELDHGNVSYLAAKGLAKTTPTPSDPNRWIFGSWPTDQLERIKDIGVGATLAVSDDTDGGETPGTEGGVTPVETFSPGKMPLASFSVANAFAGRMRPQEMPVTPIEVPAAQLRTARVTTDLGALQLSPIAEQIVGSQKQQGGVFDQLGISTGSIGGGVQSGIIAGGKVIDNLGELIGSPFNDPELWKSEIKGTSLIAAAALTSAAIPLAFPPKYWRFNNAYGETYHHWMVDGGICDNRPIQQAINAGAECIVSIELTPLSAAVQDIPFDDDRPDIGEVASDSLLNTPMSSAFYRFLETYVGEQSNAIPPSSVRMWRIAPSQTAKNAKSIGVYDFNGYWEGGQLRMGLFDWFMRGYLDAHAGQPSSDVWSDPSDNACVAYKAVAVPFLGQVGNANDKEPSPGFFVVDFVNNHPHPGYE